LASSDALNLLEKAKQEKVPITAETTFHYLYFAAEDIPNGNCLFKCCPPIREKANREKLWQALKDELITQVISDHSPCTIDLKKVETGDLTQAWGGIASLQLGLPIVWTRAKEKGFKLTDLVKWMSKQTAQLVNLGDRKGTIAVGYDADLVIWDPEESFKVDPINLYMKNKGTPYKEEKLFGVVKATLLRGQKIYDKGKLVGDKPIGGWLRYQINRPTEVVIL